VVVLGATVGGCGEAFTSRVDVAARAGPYELSVDRLAEVIATGKGLPLRRDVAEGIAHLWVDYTIFADRVASGDSLTDSGYVEAAMWAEMQQELADRYHAMLVEDAGLGQRRWTAPTRPAAPVHHTLFGEPAPPQHSRNQWRWPGPHACSSRWADHWTRRPTQHEDPASKARAPG
jgi:hypothetical protein